MVLDEKLIVLGSTSIRLGHLDLLQFALVRIWTSEMLFLYVATICNS